MAIVGAHLPFAEADADWIDVILGSFSGRHAAKAKTRCRNAMPDRIKYRQLAEILGFSISRAPETPIAATEAKRIHLVV